MTTDFKVVRGLPLGADVPIDEGIDAKCHYCARPVVVIGDYIHCPGCRITWDRTSYDWLTVQLWDCGDEWTRESFPTWAELLA